MRANNIDKMFGWMVKLGCMNEADIAERRKSILNESQESKSIDAAKKLVMQTFGWDKDRADHFVRVELRNDIPILRDKNAAKFILGVTRMYCEKQLSSARTIQQINGVLRYVASPTHINEYDRNLNGISAQQLIEKFATNVQQDFDNDKREVSSQQYEDNGQYKIVPINSFEEAQRYGKYTSWCVTHQSTMFNSYTNDGYGQFYFCLRNGFENVQPNKGENCPLDEYGLSMVAVSVDERGALSTCTCRWNHDNGGDDKIMDTKQISQLIGRNFYDVFKPNNKAAQALEEIQQFLKTATDIDRQAWTCDRLDGVSNIAFIRAAQGSPTFIVNTEKREVLMNGQLLMKAKQVVDRNYKRWPLIQIQKRNEDYNIFDPINNRMFFNEDKYFIETCFSHNGQLFTLIQDDDNCYSLYDITNRKFITEIYGVIDNKEGEEPFCRMNNILYSFYNDEKVEYYFLLDDGTLHTEEEMLENYSDNDEYYDDEYYDDYFFED